MDFVPRSSTWLYRHHHHRVSSNLLFSFQKLGVMEFVFRGNKNDYGDLFIEPAKDGSIRLSIRSKNATGQYNHVLSAEEFDLLCKIRELSIIDKEVKL